MASPERVINAARAALGVTAINIYKIFEGIVKLVLTGAGPQIGHQSKRAIKTNIP